MTRDEILDMFKQQSDSLPHVFPTPNTVILEWAQLLSESRSRLTEENFDTLVRIGGVLYKGSLDQFEARSDVADIMKKSSENRGRH